MGKMTSIQISADTQERLKDRGRMGDSYEKVVVNILNRIEELERKEAECGGLPATA